MRMEKRNFYIYQNAKGNYLSAALNPLSTLMLQL